MSSRRSLDVTGDGTADIVGFGDAGVYVSLNQGNGTFGPLTLAVANFGYVAGGWRVEKHPRFLADVTGDGTADIVGFGDAGVWVSRPNRHGRFSKPKLVLRAFGFAAGRWRVEKHPRDLADTNGDDRADIIGFGDAGVWRSRATGSGGFTAPTLVLADLGHDAGSWRVLRHPRAAVGPR